MNYLGNVGIPNKVMFILGCSYLACCRLRVVVSGLFKAIALPEKLDVVEQVGVYLTTKDLSQPPVLHL